MTILSVRRMKHISNTMRLEAEKARLKYKKYNSFHEAYAVLKEEIEEFWELVKIKQDKRIDPDSDIEEAIQKEVIQIGSITMLIMHDFDHLAKCRELKKP